MEYIKAIAERIKIPERESIEEKSTRTFAWRTNPAQEIIASLTPSLENLHQYRKEDDRPRQIGYFTSSLWLQKDRPSPASNQLQLIGGEVRYQDIVEDTPEGKKSVRQYENTAVAATRELAEEGHIYGINPNKIIPIGNRTYSFDHDYYRNNSGKHKKPHKKFRVTKVEELFMAQTPSFLSPQSFDESDRIKRILTLSPEQVTNLFQFNRLYLNQYGEWVYLQDSLSTDEELRKRQLVESDREVDAALKKTIHYYAYFNEARTTYTILEKLINLTTGRGVADYLTKRWIGILNKFAFSINQPLPADQLISMNSVALEESMSGLAAFSNEAKKLIFTIENNLTSDDIDLDAATDILTPQIIIESKMLKPGQQQLIRRRVHLIREIRQALQEVEFEENLQFIEGAGPQSAFLAAQMLLTMDKLTSHNYESISNYPDLDLVFRTLFYAFEVDPKQPDWFNNLRDRMYKYRRYKTNSVRNIAKPIEYDSYEETRKKLSEFFAYELGFEPKQIRDYIAKSYEFTEYMDKPLQGFAGAPSRAQLYPYLHDISHDFDELLLTAFRIKRDSQHKINILERWAAFKTILLAIRSVESNYIKKFNESEFSEELFRDVFINIAGYDIGQEAVFTDEKPLFRFQLKGFQYGNKLTIPNFPIRLNIENIIPEILSTWRPKTDKSLLRKDIERGDLTWNPDKTKRYIDRIKANWDITDYYGRMIIVDTDKFWQAVVDKNPWLNFRIDPLDFLHIKEQITRQWNKDVIAYLIKSFQNEFENRKYKFQRTKQRFSGFLEDLREGIEYYRPEVSSIGWTWGKEAHILTPLPENKLAEKIPPHVQFDEEVHFFPNIEEAQKKKADDPRYDRDRLFESHKPGYFPIFTVLYYPQPPYQEITRRQRKLQNIQVFPSPQYQNVHPN